MRQALTAADVEDVFHEGINAGDIEAAVSVYTDDTVFVQGDQLIQGVDALRARLESFIAARPTVRALSRQVVEFDDYAYTSVEWEIERTDEDGNTVRRTGTDAHLVQRQADGAWKVLRGTVVSKGADGA